LTGHLTSDLVKSKARELGADLVGICSAETLNNNPPDPVWAQTPGRIWPDCRSVIAIGKRIPWGLLRSDNRAFKTFPPLLVMNKLDDITLNLTYFIEEHGGNACPTSQNLTDTELKNGSYGALSFRHVAIEAGLGTLGLNMLLLTPEFGPRVYVTAVLTDVELTYDKPLSKSLCLGPSCGRCLLACPSDAVEYWALNKKKCAENAQAFGTPSFTRLLKQVLQANTLEERQALLSPDKITGYWQALRTGSMAYGGCSDCWLACPIGQDYPKHLKDKYARLAEPPKSRIDKRDCMAKAEKSGELGNYRFSQRWIKERN